MKRQVLKYLFLIVLTMGLISCGGGGDSDSKIIPPTVETNENGDILVTGKIFFDSDVNFEKMSFEIEEDESCLLDYSFPNGNVYNGELDYVVTIDGFCSNVDRLFFKGKEVYTKSNIDGSKSKIETKDYNREIVFKSLDLSKNFDIEVEPSIIKADQVSNLFIRIKDSRDNELNNADVLSVLVRSGDSGKLSFLNEQNESIGEIEYSNLSYNEIVVKAKNSGSVNLTIQALLKSGSNRVKLKKYFTIEIEEDNLTAEDNTTVYTINSSAEDLLITQPNEVKSVELYVYRTKNGMSLPYEDRYINVNFVGDMRGSFDSYSKKTDNSGRVSFTYTAPSVIDGLSDLTVRFYIADKSYIDKNITISFSTHSIVENAKLQLTPQEINVTNSSTEYQVKVLVVDQDSKPIKDVKLNILAELVSNGVDYGSVDKSQITTDENGIATFIYTSPKDSKLLYGLSKNIVVNIEDTNISKTITIKYSQKPNTSAVAKIALDPSSFIVNSDIEQQIAVYTYDSSNRPISTEIYVESLISSDGTVFGEITPAIFRTDENGKATLTYKAPADMDKFSGETKNVKISANNGVYSNLTLKFPPKADVAAKIILSPSKIKVVEGLSQSIDVLTLTNDNRPISANITIPIPFDEDGKPLGSFDRYSFQTDDLGKGSVVYTAPADLSGIFGDKNVTLTTEGLSASALLMLSFDTTVETEKKEYEIKLLQPSSIVVKGSGNIVVDIVEKDSEDKYIDDLNVSSVKVEMQNHLLTFDENGTQDSYEYNSSSRKSIEVFSGYNSGVEVVKVTATIFNGDYNETIFDNFPITILSGPVSAISMVYKSSEYNNSFFEDRFTLHAVDKYGNPAKKGTRINVGVVSGVRKDNNGKYLKIDENGSLNLGDGNVSEFSVTDPSYDLTTVHDKYNSFEGSDTLIILANEEKMSPLYMGGWIIQKVKDERTLLLDGNFSGSSSAENNLSFVIGDEKRYNKCGETYNVVDFDEEDKTYVLDDKGNADLIVRYDPFFVGHDIFLYANSVYEQNRVGVSLRKKLWGTGVYTTTRGDDSTFICDNRDSNKSKNCKFNILFRTEVQQLIDVNFTKYNFDIQPATSKYPCNDNNITIEINNTGCTGQIRLEANVQGGHVCEIYWNGSIPTEVFKP